jgi:hypothetical protein
MPSSPNLPDEQLVRAGLNRFAKGDAKLLHHARRHIMVKPQYDERGTPMQRSLLKAALYARQNGVCALCSEAMPMKDSELDRLEGLDGYNEGNCRVVHHACHRKSQEAKNYS